MLSGPFYFSSWVATAFLVLVLSPRIFSLSVILIFRNLIFPLWWKSGSAASINLTKTIWGVEIFWPSSNSFSDSPLGGTEGDTALESSHNVSASSRARRDMHLAMQGQFFLTDDGESSDGESSDGESSDGESKLWRRKFWNSRPS